MSKSIFSDPALPDRLAERLNRALPGRRGQSRFEPELAFGRHYAPPAPDARPAAVLILLYPKEDHWHIPFTVRPDSMVDHAGQVSFPGGLIEPDESSDVAALRELEEELGIAPDRIRLLGPLSPLYLFVTNFAIAPWVAALDARPEMRPNPHEVHEVLEVPLRHLNDPANLGHHQRKHLSMQFSAPHVAWQSHRIWGATGMVLGELLSVIDELAG